MEDKVKEEAVKEDLKEEEEEEEEEQTLIAPEPPRISQRPQLVPSVGEVYRHTMGLDNKNPVAALHEVCQRNKWSPPQFKEVRTNAKRWIFSVVVNGKEYSDLRTEGKPKKKEAKMEAARYCLKKHGIL